MREISKASEISIRPSTGKHTFSEADLAAYADAYRGRERLRGGFAHYRTLLADGEDKPAHAIGATPGLSVPRRHGVRRVQEP